MDILGRKYIPAKLNDCGGKLKTETGGNADWYVYYSVWDSDKEEMHRFNKRGRINYLKSVHERRKEGNYLCRVVNQLLAQGRLTPFKPKEEQPTLIELFNKETELKKHNLRRRTWQSYTYSTGLLIKWMRANKLEHLYPGDFTKQHARGFCDYMIAEKKYAGITFNDRKRDIGIYFNSFVDKEIITSNPFKKIKSVPQEMGKNIAFSDSQRKKLTEHLKKKNYRLFLFTQFIYFCYLRPIEILRLKVSNVDAKRNIITIYGNQSKNKKTESVVIPNAFKLLIKEMQLHKHGADDFIFGRGLFTCDKSIGRNSVTSRHKKFLTELKFNPLITLYSWKGSGVIAAFKAGIDIYSIMRQCRHASINQTMTYLKSLGLYPNVEFSSKMK